MLRILSALIIFCSFFLSCSLSEKRKLKAENYHQIAVSVLGQCNNHLALNHLLKGIRINSKDFKIRNTLATVYFSLGEHQKAIHHFQRLLQAEPHVTEARLSLAHSYLKIKKYNQALFEIAKAEKDSSYNKPLKIMELKALIYFDQKNFLKAKSFFQEAQNLSQEQTCFRQTYLGRIEKQFNQLRSAEKLLRQATALCAKQNKQIKCKKQRNHQAHYFLAQVYKKQKQVKKMRYHLKVFLKNSKFSDPYYKQAKKILQPSR